MNEESLVSVATFDNPNVAHVFRLKLQANEIKAALDNEHHVTTDWFVLNAVGGVKLLVLAKDRSRALNIINERTELPMEICCDDPSPIGDDEFCPKCESMEVYLERFDRKWVFLSIMVLGFPIPFYFNSLICENCAHQWNVD